MQSRRFYLVTFILALSITGCTSTYVKRNFPTKSAFIEKLSENSGSADIITKNDSLISASDLRVTGDSLQWKDSGANERSVLPLKDIKEITFVHHWGSSITYGAFSGLLLGGVVSGVLLEDETNPRWSRHPYMSGQWEDGGISPVIPGAFAGFLAGGIFGLVAGNDEHFVFDDSPSGKSLKSIRSTRNFGIKIGGHSILTKRSDDSYRSRLTIKGVPSMGVTFFYKYPLDRFFSIRNELSYLYSSSKADFSVFLPGEFEGYEARGKTEERLSIIELASAFKINLMRSRLTPYLLIGPKLDILFPGKSGLSKTLEDIKSQNYSPAGTALSSEYSRVVWGTILGAGFSTGSIFPTELFIEGVYNLDFSTRIKMHNNLDDFGLKYNEFQLNIGAAIF
ncbi:MAG: outer membrane beta-barrel protein [Acidobacteriota bacterium]